MLVVDAAIQIALVRGGRTEAFARVLGAAHLITTSRAVDEAYRRIRLGMKREDLLPAFGKLGAVIDVMDVSELQWLIPRAEETLRVATPARNGSVSDAHILALAWVHSADIWSPDRDFAGTGVASWSTHNLERALLHATS